MNERDLQVLEQYPFTVNGSWRTRGAFLLDTSAGRLLIREFSGSDYKLQKEQELLQHLKDCGYLVDRMEPDQEGRLATVYREYFRFVVKESLDGRECDTRSESEILKAASLLAGIHKDLRGFCEVTEEERLRLSASDAVLELGRHNRELRKIYTFIRKKNKKNEFESAYLSCCLEVLLEAQNVERRLRDSSYEKLRDQALTEGHFCHGEYIHHNILVGNGKMAVINFEKFALDVQVNDLYLFMRKILEKQNYDFRLGSRILDSYEQVRPLSMEEREYLSLRMQYPEKFWKLANYYYNTNKAWVPGKHMEKLEKFLSQREKRVSFSREILYNKTNYTTEFGR
ncbi:MAG: CotS family spore coat protein [Lachnospiraceae bacterium]|nr:CotS family spore coat protein [Lachnospiraceae bacterium]